MHWLQFGRIEGLSIVNGEPQWDSQPRIIRCVKIPVKSFVFEPCAADFKLKGQFVDLFWLLNLYESAMVHRLEFRFGLPALLEILGCRASEDGHSEVERW
jgi:hypothetical protein